MSNNLSISGGQPQKPTRFAPIYTGRWSSGLWTNRSPLRDANTSRMSEKFYGPSGDALIAGSNVEITNKLTLARRPGTSTYDSNSYSNVDFFYSFKLFNSNTEQINVMVDQANALYSLEGGIKTLVWTKSAGAGQTFMQSIGNTLYFANGVDNKKWLQSLFVWTSNTLLNINQYPFNSTIMYDNNGHILELLGSAFPINQIDYTGSTSTSAPFLTLHSSIDPSTVVSVGDMVTIPSMSSSNPLKSLNGTHCTVLSFPSSSTVAVTYPLDQVFSFAATNPISLAYCYVINGGKPTTGSTKPLVNPTNDVSTNGVVATVYQAINNQFAGNPGTVIDGTALWAGRGTLGNDSSNGVFSWGMTDSAVGPTPNPLYYFDGSYHSNLQTWTKLTASGAVTISTPTYIIDSNGNIQKATTGTTGTVQPIWNTILAQTTADNTVSWTLVATDSVSALNGGYQYCVALVNSIDGTVSTCSKLSAPTGNFSGSIGVQIGAANLIYPTTTTSSPLFNGLQTTPQVTSSGLTINPQADYVAIFRTTDGQSVPFLIPGKDGEIWTVSLSEYLLNGYLDNTPDTGLNNLISAPINGETTPPQVGAQNLVLYLDRLFYSVGNVVYWTQGLSTPVGNGYNGYTPASNFSATSSLVKRLVPTPVGLFVFTVSDVYIIQGKGTANDPIQGAVPIVKGMGLQSYNALDINGSTIGLFTADNQFVTLDPSDAVSYVGLPIGDQLRLNTGSPGKSWNPSNVYVTWHVQGEDQAWYLSDGTNGWYRLMTTPAPETGLTWCPFATITGGAKAVQSIETDPGVHKLLIGPVSTGSILQRDLSVFTDNGTPYSANATVGSCVLTQPGQVAAVSFITTDSVNTGTPLVIGFLVNEALPYYTGPIDILKRFEYDPPSLPVSQSILSQRFYMSESQDEVQLMRHCQIQVIWSPTDVVQNELLTMTIFGAFYQEL